MDEIGLAVVFAFVLGAVVGSFLNLVAYRLPRGESVVRPRSRCPNCQRPVAAYDNVPIVSWLLLRGRCRHCHESISPRYLVIEALTAALFVALVATDGVEKELLVDLPFAALMVLVAAVDLEHRIVPNRVLAVAFGIGIATTLTIGVDTFTSGLIAGLIAGGFLLIAALAYPAGMGMGDVKLAAVMGLYLGSAVAPALLIGFAAGASVGIVTLIREGAGARKKALPFAPFLAIGGIAALFVGPQIVDWYLDSFF